MYSSIYLHRVPHYNIDAFVHILNAAAKLYGEHGAVACRLYAPKNMAAKYDCLPFGDVITIAEHEHFFIEVNEFHDLAHHDVVMAKVDADPRIHQLYEDLKVIVDVSCIVRGEFEQIL